MIIAKVKLECFEAWTAEQLEMYDRILRRDEAVIGYLVKVIKKVGTTKLKELNRLVFTNTSDRQVVPFDVKGKFANFEGLDLQHNEAQECLLAALRIVKRQFIGKEEGCYNRVIHNRRFGVDYSGEIRFKRGKIRFPVKLDTLPEGKIQSIRLLPDAIEVHFREIDNISHLPVVGIDIGKEFAVSLLGDSNQDHSDLSRVNKLFCKTSEVLDYLNQFPKLAIYIGYAGMDYSSELHNLYYPLLDAGHIVRIINESYTSKTCSQCGRIGERVAKIFWCPFCKWQEHADVNGAINISHKGIKLMKQPTNRQLQEVPTFEPNHSEYNPLDLTDPNLAELVGYILGDGHINKRGEIQISMHSDQTYLMDELNRLVESTLKFSLNAPYECLDENTSIQRVLDRIVVDVLLANGMHAGSKTQNQVDIPDWIKSDHELYRRCVKGLFETDGSIFWHERKTTLKNRIELDFSNLSRPLLQSVNTFFHLHGIKSYLQPKHNPDKVRIESRDGVYQAVKLIRSTKFDHWLREQKLTDADVRDTFMRASEFEEFVQKGYVPRMIKDGRAVPVRTIEDHLILKERKGWKKTPTQIIDEIINKRNVKRKKK